MQAITFLYEISSFATSFFGWRDLCEITLISTIVYYFSRWLSFDSTKNLLGLFYAYLASLYVSYLIQLTTITIFLLYFSPIAALILIIMHQEQLQKNYITYKKINLVNDEIDHDWMEIVIQICLQTINKNKKITLIIERSDSLKDYFNIPFTINTQINKTLLALLIESNWYDDNKFIWISESGTLVSINAECKKIKNNLWIDSTIQSYEDWKQDAFALSKKTDAIVICITPASRLFTFTHDGKIIEKIQGPTMLQLIKKILINETKKGFVYGFTHKDNLKQI